MHYFIWCGIFLWSFWLSALSVPPPLPNMHPPSPRQHCNIKSRKGFSSVQALLNTNKNTSTINPVFSKNPNHNQRAATVKKSTFKPAQSVKSYISILHWDSVVNQCILKTFDGCLCQTLNSGHLIDQSSKYCSLHKQRNPLCIPLY